MKSNEERITLLHLRADKLRRDQNRNHLIASGSVSALLLTALIVITVGLENSSIDTSESLYAASSLLSENAGGFVLAGVVAFMAGVIITVIIRRYLENKTKKREEKKNV